MQCKDIPFFSEDTAWGCCFSLLSVWEHGCLLNFLKSARSPGYYHVYFRKGLLFWRLRPFLRLFWNCYLKLLIVLTFNFRDFREKVIKDPFPQTETLFLFISSALFVYLLPLLFLLLVARERRLKLNVQHSSF